MKRKPQSPSSRVVVHGQASWRLATAGVEAFVTELGGHLGPVAYKARGKTLSPYSVAPWCEEKVGKDLPAVIRVLRGDFFCMPFGGNATPYCGERHPVHGETANARWRLEGLGTSGEMTCLHLSLRSKVREGRVDKRILIASADKPENIVYSEHVISGMSGPMNLGHHAMLRFPDARGRGLSVEGGGWSGIVSLSRFVHGQVCPERLEDPAKGGYSALKPGAAFSSLEKVETANGEVADLSRYPARRGFEDLVMVVADPDLPFAWSTVTFPQHGYVWFALKDPRVLAGTILWISNGGRHYPPWSGRHLGVLGIEEVTSYFHFGLAEAARENPFSREGYPTCLRLDARRPLVVRYIMGVALVPAGFDRVAELRALPGGRGIELSSASGKRARAPVRLDFLERGGRV